MSYLETKPRIEFSQEAIEHYMRQFNKLQRRPKIREYQRTHDKVVCAEILKTIHREGSMTKKAIIELSNGLDGEWTLAQYSTRMTKLKKDNPGQIKYNKNLKYWDEVKSSKKQEKLKWVKKV